MTPALSRNAAPKPCPCLGGELTRPLRLQSSCLFAGDDCGDCGPRAPGQAGRGGLRVWAPDPACQPRALSRVASPLVGSTTSAGPTRVTGVGASGDEGSGTSGACLAAQGRAHCGGRSAWKRPPCPAHPKAGPDQLGRPRSRELPTVCLGPALAPPGPWRSPVPAEQRRPSPPQPPPPSCLPSLNPGLLPGNWGDCPPLGVGVCC